MANRYKSIGEQLLAMREALSLTREVVAKRAGVSSSLMRQIELGYTDSPGTKAVGRIAKALGCIVVIYSAERICVEALPQ